MNHEGAKYTKEEGRRKKEEGRANKISVNIVIISNLETLPMIFISDTNELTTY
jgi:hypothetical protein